MKYVKELLNRVLLSIICCSITFVAAYSYKEILLFEVINPSLNYQNLNDNYFIFTNITELFTVYFDLSFFLSTQILLIYIFYSLLIFLSPSLYSFEYKFFKTIFQFFLVFWLFSNFVFNFFMIPFLWNFFLSFKKNLFSYSILIHFEAKVSDYVSFFMYIYFGCMFQFQLLLVLVLFFRYYSINKVFIKKHRNIFYFVFLLLATLFTPPDLTSQLIIFIGLIFIFEIIVLITFITKKL